MLKAKKEEANLFSLVVVQLGRFREQHVADDEHECQGGDTDVLMTGILGDQTDDEQTQKAGALAANIEQAKILAARVFRNDLGVIGTGKRLNGTTSTMPVPMLKVLNISRSGMQIGRASCRERV